jgi:hypothetical protein
VLHCTGDRVAPLQEEGREIARLIQGASFVELPGNNHVLLAGTPAFDRFLEEATDSVAAHATWLPSPDRKRPDMDGGARHGLWHGNPA